MGLFNNLFNKQKIHPTVKNIYQNLNPKFKNKIFYGDLTQANEVLMDITNRVFDDVNDINLNTCFQIYLQVFIRSHGGLSQDFSMPEYITERLCERFSSVSSQIVTKCVNFSLEYIYKNEPQLLQQVQMYKMIQKQVLENAEKNKHLFELYIHDEDYGLVPNKPVFVAGFGGAKEYLSQLVNNEGVSPDIERLGSSEINGISGPVDLYLLSFSQGDQRQIFICNYGFNNSSVAPKGFEFKS